MNSRWTLSIVCVILFLSVIAFSLYLFETYPKEKVKIYYLPSTDYLKLVSGTFRPLFAETLFIKGVLELSEGIPDRQNYLSKLFLTSIQLDPKLISACFFGGMVVPRTRQDIPLGIRFLKEAMKLNPIEWRIPYWIGFNYFQLQDYLKAAEYYQQASALPGSPSFLTTNLAMFYYWAGKPELALWYLEGLYQSVGDERLLELIRLKMDWLKNIVFLEKKVKEYKKIYGYWPKDLEELIKKGLLDKIPEDPFGRGYELDEEWYRGPGRVKSRF